MESDRHKGAGKDVSNATIARLPSRLIGRSKIDKLSILGIRSFDNTRSETIQFHSPLTLIVGYNGSGKTTIIECLKYATTGDLPPNSKGGAFIHDPKLCGEKEVLAQVKLSFNGTSGAKMVCTRSMQLTVKKATRAMKTLEGHLLMLKDGQRMTISSKVAELDQLLPQYLGVSKAVLDSVIFCHQDESLWPMSEPSVLKKKFDEIFEALKYSKAIDNIKSLRKKQNEALTSFKHLENQYKIDQERAERLEKASTKLSAEIEAMREETETQIQKMKELSQKSEENWVKYRECQAIVGTLNGLKIQAETMDNSIRSSERTTTLMKESDEWLAQALEKHEEIMAQHQHNVETQDRVLKGFESELQTIQSNIGTKMSELGKLAAEKEAFDRQAERRQSMIREIARRHDIRGYDSELDEMQLSEFMTTVPVLIREQTTALERKKREYRGEIQKAQNSLSHLKQRKSTLRQQQEHSKAEIKELEKKLADITPSGVSAFDSSAAAALEKSLQNTRDTLKTEKATFTGADWDNKISQAHAHVADLEKQHQNAQSRLMENSRHAGDRAKLDYLRKELKDKNSSLNGLLSSSRAKFDAVLGLWTLETLESDYESVCSQRASEFADITRQRDGVSRDLDQVETKMRGLRETLRRKENDAADAKKSVSQALEIEEDDIDTYPTVVQTIEANYTIRKSDVDNLAQMTEYYEQARRIANDKSICRLCDRHLKEGKELDRFVSKLSRQLDKAKPEELKEELQEFEAELKGARDVSTAYDTYKRLMAEIPEAKDELAKVEQRKEVLVKQLQAENKSCMEATTSKEMADSLSRIVQSISKTSIEVSDIERRIADSMDVDDSNAESLEEIQVQITQLLEQLKLGKAELSSQVQGRDEAGSRINTLERQALDDTAKLSELRFEAEKHEMLLSRAEELRTSLEKQRSLLRSAESEEESFASDYAAAEAQYEEVQKSSSESEASLQRKISKLSEDFSQVKVASVEMDAFLAGGGETVLTQHKKEIDSLKTRQETIEAKRRQLIDAVDLAKSQLRDQVDTKNTIAKNIEYRAEVARLKHVRAKIAELLERDAEAESEQWKVEAERYTTLYNRLSGLHQSQVGAMKTKDDQLVGMLEDWDRDYKDTATNYKEAHIKVETTKAAIDDLGLYGTALDNAVMKYHSLKMEEINRIMEELWRKAYQGTDIDTILIKSDDETAKGNRSYNYRVCMVKQDTEMDMRGRCSAGQRVLACIVIRLALAECFGVGCGIIALDEPTTNLDRENVRSLAESLHDIINARQQQANFQLIVITHDEEFLSAMKCSDFCDDYWRVSRDERQKSVIEKQSIAEVM